MQGASVPRDPGMPTPKNLENSRDSVGQMCNYRDMPAAATRAAQPTMLTCDGEEMAMSTSYRAHRQAIGHLHEVPEPKQSAREFLARCRRFVSSHFLDDGASEDAAELLRRELVFLSSLDMTRTEALATIDELVAKVEATLWEDGVEGPPDYPVRRALREEERRGDGDGDGGVVRRAGDC